MSACLFPVTSTSSTRRSAWRRSNVLERLGVEVEFPEEQTCCGQPLANAGLHNDARPLAERFLQIFAPYDYVVSPPAVAWRWCGIITNKCSAIRRNSTTVAHKTFELCEFLTDVLKIDRLAGSFPHRVGLHQSCHGLRELRTASDSELVGPTFNKPRQLLASLDGIELTELTRPDECCGFGGLFAVSEEAVSCMMGRDRVADHERAGTEVLTSTDMSCLMHLEGLIRRAAEADPRDAHRRNICGSDSERQSTVAEAEQLSKRHPM